MVGEGSDEPELYGGLGDAVQQLLRWLRRISSSGRLQRTEGQRHELILAGNEVGLTCADQQILEAKISLCIYFAEPASQLHLLSREKRLCHSCHNLKPQWDKPRLNGIFNVVPMYRMQSYKSKG